MHLFGHYFSAKVERWIVPNAEAEIRMTQLEVFYCSGLTNQRAHSQTLTQFELIESHRSFNFVTDEQILPCYAEDSYTASAAAVGNLEEFRNHCCFELASDRKGWNDSVVKVPCLQMDCLSFVEESHLRTEAMHSFVTSAWVQMVCFTVSLQVGWCQEQSTCHLQSVG